MGSRVVRRITGVVLAALACAGAAVVPCRAQDIVEDLQIGVEQKLRIQKNADDTAAEAAGRVNRHQYSAASKLVRSRVQEALGWDQASYAVFIQELNERLDHLNVLHLLGLHQHPNAALTPVQFQAECELYGNRTLPAAILAMIRPEAIRQGKLGDCWFLSSLAVVANDYPFLIPSYITVNPDGSYLVRFPGNPSQPIHVEPLDASYPGGVQPTSYGRWPEVLERAVAKVYPNEIRNGGPVALAIKVLTGIDTVTWALYPTSAAPQLTPSGLGETVVKALDTNFPILISTKNGDPSQSAPFLNNHAYSVVGYERPDTENGARVTLRNPWGRLENGASTAMGIVTESDGRFQLPVPALNHYFGWVTVAKSVIIPFTQPQTGTASNPNGSSLRRVPSTYIPGGTNQQTVLPPVPRSYIRK